MRAGSSEPKLAPVGVTSQRSPASRALILPVLPCVRPRSWSERATDVIWSLSASSVIGRG
jgi:hypothetical protein